jgi:hypothetical protein
MTQPDFGSMPSTDAPHWPPWIEELRTKHFLLSASSYKLARRCLRRWAYKEIAKRREPEDSAKLFGTHAHAQAEAFLRDGTAPDLATKEGRLFLESLPHIPRPGIALVEHPFAFEIDGAWFWGMIDWVDLATETKGDHKFVGSLDYAETPESLLEDPAAVLYTLALPSFVVTRLRWIYNLKRKRRDQVCSNPVDAEMHILRALEYTRKHLVPAWHLLDGIRSIFAGLEPDAALPLLEAIPCNPRDCLAFNRPCPHMAYCSRERPGTLEESICQ